jgi:Reverse transcriptase (RNA-dependent DNA polymerase)
MPLSYDLVSCSSHVKVKSCVSHLSLEESLAPWSHDLTPGHLTFNLATRVLSLLSSFLHMSCIRPLGALTLVAKGFSQVEGIDFNKIFSPIVRFETIWLMLMLAALEHWHITSVDIKTVFLYGELDEELYMEQPEGFKTRGQEHKVLYLKHTIYGLHQAALQ